VKYIARLAVCGALLWAVAAQAQQHPDQLGNGYGANLPLVVRAANTPTPTRTPTRTPTPTQPAGQSSAEQVVALINQYRAANTSCGPLTLNAKITQAAQLHAVDMLENDFFDHTGSDGAPLGVRLDRQDYNWSTAAENIAAGYTTAQEAVNGWLTSSGHLANIENCTFTETGVGYVFDPNDGGAEDWQHYWVQDFARPQQ
jgi:uncharacterized protein YkwD